jgi:phosphoribosyl isomerase A
MKAIPAIDLREGACVQLVGGSYDAERVRLPDALAVAEDFAAKGFRTLHVVDLDAATGKGSNSALVSKLAARGDVQVGGGVRNANDIQRWLDAGAARVIVGTRAVEEPAWLATMAARFPRRLVLAADVRGMTVVTRGWVHEVGALETVLATTDGLPLAGVLVTAVHREGQLQGTDTGLFTTVTRATSLPVVASGGVTTREDLLALANAGCAAAVVGMALYTGRLDASAIAKEFAS